MRRVVVALLAAAALFVGIPLFIAFSASHNGYSTCSESEPHLDPPERLVQIKDRVSLFPLALECSYTKVERPTAADYTVVTTDLGTGWWVAAPVCVVAAVVVWGAGRRMSRRARR